MAPNPCQLQSAVSCAGSGSGSAAPNRAEPVVSFTDPLRLAVFAATAVGLSSAALHIFWRWLGKSSAKFEFGSTDLSTYTKEAAKALHGVVKKGSKKQAPQKALLTSLIPDTMQDLEETGDGLEDAVSPSEELDTRAKVLQAVGAPPFRRFLKERGAADLVRKRCEVFQLNVGLYCNQACTHCHVESSPLRKEMMSEDVVDRCLHLLKNSPHVKVLDLTGGAPELNSGFRKLVEGAAALRDKDRPDLRILDRCNLTVLLEPGQEHLPAFLRQHGVEIVASMPSYDAAQVDKQRGRKVFERSIKGLQMLNEQGYGKGKGLTMDLIFNSPGPFLPPKQEALEKKYREEMGKKHDVSFTGLITLTNMPVKRYFDFLRKQGALEGYMDLLVRNFNADTVPNLMCVNTISVSWNGRMYDCDFNQQLDMTIGRPALSVFDIDTLDDERLVKASIATAAHCFGCTASQGSS